MNKREGSKAELNRVNAMKRDVALTWRKEQIEAGDDDPNNDEIPK